MCCVTSVSFAVLINGEAIDFFKVWRGICQGFPLSPYLFIMIMEGLSLMLSKSSVDHSISSIEITKLLKIVHLMFVDDILVMSKVDPLELRVIIDILQAYCHVSEICINTLKTTVHYWGLKEAELYPLKDILPFTFADLSTGFKYLGYYLNLGSSKYDDWSSLVEKIEKKIGLWCNKWLSLRGRFILVKSALESLLVFWISLEVIPRTILNKICKLSCSFLWSGHKEKFQFHLCRWDLLARPKICRGWGLKNLPTFNSALIENTFWRALTHGSIWNIILLGKYLGNSSISTWLRKSYHQQQKASSFWNGMTIFLCVILHWMRWILGSGTSISLGRDQIISLENQLLLSESLRSHLSNIHITSLAHARDTDNISSFLGRWRSSDSLSLGGQDVSFKPAK
jgi:hypothetical protein